MKTKKVYVYMVLTWYSAQYENEESICVHGSDFFFFGKRTWF